MQKVFKRQGLEVNVTALGEGIYKLIEEKGEEGLVAFGMIPAWAIDTFEKQLTEKLAGMPDAPKLVKEIVHQVSVAIYQAADKAGKMIA